MSYVSENLMPNEKVYYTARVHRAVLLAPVLVILMGLILAFLPLIGSNDEGKGTWLGFGLCIFAIFLLSAVVLAVQTVIAMLTTEFAVTNRRIIGKRGWIRRHTVELLLTKVESVVVNQNIAGRIFNFGTVVVTGTGGTHDGFRMIAEPLVVRMKINQVIEAATHAAFAAPQPAATRLSA